MLTLNRLLEPVASYGLDGIDKKLRDIIGQGSGFYIEAGANDGVRQSNTLLFENSGGWGGLLIEPIPDNFRELRHNRSSKRNQLVNVALVSENFQGNSLELFKAGQMSVPVMPSAEVSDPRAHAEQGLRVQSKFNSKQLETAVVPACTLGEVLSRVRAPKLVDFFSLDVEGWELEVLSGVNFEEWEFSWILVETRDLPRLCNFMEAKSYEFHSMIGHRDALFRKSRELRSRMGEGK